MTHETTLADLTRFARADLARLDERERTIRWRINIIEQALPLLRRRAEGETLTAIGASLGISYQRVQQIIRQARDV